MAESRCDRVVKDRLYAHDIAESVGLKEGQYPKTVEEAQRVEKTLQEEMAKLPVEERERIMFEMHGIDTVGEEISEEAISTALEQLNVELAEIHHDDKVAYGLARSLDQSYVDDRDFQLMFLQCERFNAKEAAKLIVHHFSIKYELFIQDRKKKDSTFDDESILVRDIHWDDLDASDKTCLMSGFVQICPDRDVAGRVILFASQTRIMFFTYSMNTLGRANWYFTMALLRDEQTRIHGSVFILYNYLDRSDGFNLLKEYRRLDVCIPLKFVFGHYCCSQESFRPIASTLQLVLLDHTERCRFMTHFGDPQTVAFKLQTFGIPIEHSPLKEIGYWSVEWHHQWLEMQQEWERRHKESVQQRAELEEILDEVVTVVVPRRYDVLFGKNRQASEHQGNLRCRHLVEMHWDEYEDANRKDKTKLADRIVDLVHESQGRFLRWDETVWVEVDRKAAREKVSHFFRFKRSQLASSSGDGQPERKRQTSAASASSATAGSSSAAEYDSFDEDESDARGGRRLKVAM